MGRSESRKHHPSRCIMVVRWKKSMAFTFLCSSVPSPPQPTLRFLGWVKEAIFVRRKLARGNAFSLENVFKPGDRINGSKTKEMVDEGTPPLP